MIAADPRGAVLGSEIAERLIRDAGYDFESTEYFRLMMKLANGAATAGDICGGWFGRQARRYCGGTITGIAFPCLSNRADRPPDREVLLKTDS